MIRPIEVKERLMTRTNDITLFSNGIGHFRRVYKVCAEETITIPFKTDYIGDVAASLQVFGKVRLVAPPSFTPANSNATALNIDQANALTSLLRQLSGAAVKVVGTVDATLEGTLLGVEVEVAERSGSVIERSHIVVLTNEGVRKLPFEYMGNVSFTEESVQLEVEKALKNNFQRIKPDSTLLDLSLAEDSDGSSMGTEAVVQYTLPVAAWKMRYAIREEKGKFSLEGAAIIDNNTDENWDNFRVSVVTGNPISFGTDIAQVVVPQRKFIRLVEETALSNVDVEEGSMMLECAAPQPRAACHSLGPKMSVSNRAAFGFSSDDVNSLQQLASGDAGMDMYYSDMEVAVAPEVESKDVGDFCVFTSKEPITLLARKSAVVPMFTVDLKQAGVVLLYKEANHSSRPYRAVKFKNETDFSLGKGKTVIYNDGVFSGECVLDTTKPGENRMLPHCLENGVSIRAHRKAGKIEQRAVRISDGVGYNDLTSTAVTEYRIKNKKDESFKVALEHVNALSPNATVVTEGVEVAEQEKLSRGYRFYLELMPNQETLFTVTEKFTSQQEVILGTFIQIKHWISDGLPLLEDPKVAACAKLQEEIDTVELEIQKSMDRSRELTEQAERVRQNIGVTQQSSEHEVVAAWIKDLDTTEKEIRRIAETEVPGLRKKVKELQTQLRASLKEITVSCNV
jgi:hypothetical protein